MGQRTWVLCPNSRNGYSGVYDPSYSLGYDTSNNRIMIVVSFLIFMAGINWIVTNLLTKRTGAVLSSVLVTVFYVVVMFWTLHFDNYACSFRIQSITNLTHQYLLVVLSN